MLSYHPISSNFIIDGGINSYEREKKYNFYYNFNPLIDESHINYFFNYEVNKLFDFNKFINIQK